MFDFLDLRGGPWELLGGLGPALGGPRGLLGDQRREQERGRSQEQTQTKRKGTKISLIFAGGFSVKSHSGQNRIFPKMLERKKAVWHYDFYGIPRTLQKQSKQTLLTKGLRAASWRGGRNNMRKRDSSTYHSDSSVPVGEPNRRSANLHFHRLKLLRYVGDRRPQGGGPLSLLRLSVRRLLEVS